MEVLMGTNTMNQLLPEEYRTMSSEELDARISRAKEKLQGKLVILGHHYQRDDVIQYADYRGDSLRLAKIGAELKDVEYVVFCGVHFMAETSNILGGKHQKVILPDLNAGCSMADMAEISEVEEAWEILTERWGETIIPVTYVNSSAAIKSFVGKHGGTTCTSSNAHQVLEWAFQQKKRIFFLPDQHLGRNTAFAMGIPLEEMIIWNPISGEVEDQNCTDENVRMILWKGHCSVHQKFTPEQIKYWRAKDSEIKVIVHPECCFEVVQAADLSGSTSFIIKQVEAAPAGTKWAIGTEVNLVQRLAKEHPEQQIELLSSTICPCLTMNRIDRPHLLWALESIVAGEPIHLIEVDEEIKHWSKIAIERMFAVS